MTVSAHSGCGTVQRPAAPDPPPGTAPSLPSVPRPDGSAEPKVVQAPVKEALEMVGPSRPPARPSAGPPHTPGPPPTPAPPRPPAGRAATPHPQPHRTHTPRTDLPDVTGSVPKAPDVCALGKQYGGWRADSPQARICEQPYGH